MFTEPVWTRETIGDVDVVFHGGLYHLFHLVLPNHDFIAHAISDNALEWRRVDNALFIGNPGSWDDLMLWTVHVSADPYRSGKWRMFYTGLSRRDRGLKQRVGLAVSDDLFNWRKASVCWVDRRGSNDPPLVKDARRLLPRGISDNIRSKLEPESCFPLEPDSRYYEHAVDGDRNWISFRDPFYFRDNGDAWLLVGARVNHGPLIRRGCVALLKETAPNEFESLPPLHHPNLYDDIEVPNLLKLDDEYFLIGSQREDAKIRYWHSPKMGEAWKSYYDNVLLPQGNYAGRIVRDDRGVLLFNFYTKVSSERLTSNLMPPPKRLVRRSDGQLHAATFEGITSRKIDVLESPKFESVHGDQQAALQEELTGRLRFQSNAGFRMFICPQSLTSFFLTASLELVGVGKCGLVTHIEPNTLDGYYVSLDLMKGLAQIRSWGTGKLKSGEQMAQFDALQAGYWYDETPRKIEIRLLSYGSYHELCINDKVILSLADATFGEGCVGFYVESAELLIDKLRIQRLDSPSQSDEHLTNG